jgi:hypothetical protein
MKILNIVFYALVILVLLKIDITLRPFKISWNPPFMSLLGFLLIIIGWSITSYDQTKKAKESSYLEGYGDALQQVLDDFQVKKDSSSSKTQPGQKSF